MDNKGAYIMSKEDSESIYPDEKYGGDYFYHLMERWGRYFRQAVPYMRKERDNVVDLLFWNASWSGISKKIDAVMDSYASFVADSPEEQDKIIKKQHETVKKALNDEIKDKFVRVDHVMGFSGFFGYGDFVITVVGDGHKRVLRVFLAKRAGLPSKFVVVSNAVAETGGQ